MKSLPGIVVGLAVLAVSGVRAEDRSLTLQARDILRERCHGCHKGPGSKGGHFNAIDFASLLKPAGNDDKAAIVPFKSAQSALWQKIAAGEMPEDGSVEKEKFKPAEKDILKNWIDAGAPAWPEAGPAPDRPFITIPQMLASIRDDLRNAREQDRPFLRYYTLSHLHNQPRARISDADMRLYRAAFSKAINSLNWKRQIVLPRSVDKESTVFCIDLRDLDWDRQHLWRYVVGCYPYGLAYDKHQDPAFSDPYNEIVRMTGNKLPFIRADWLVACATRPPLYHALLELPETARELEQKLDVDIPTDFRRGRLMRAGFATSKVSQQANRLIERHDAAYGAYWKSYDFRSGEDRIQLTKFPLGPVFDGNPFNEQAFHQAGGEIFFSLPNGLQGYMLVNAKDERIDVGPIDVVSDSQRTSGTPAIVNGLSCIACHVNGMKSDFKDEIRHGAAVQEDAKSKVLTLYPEPQILAERARADRKQFLDAERTAMAPFLLVGEDANRPIESFDEPVGKIARYYRLDDLDAAAAAAELGTTSAELISAIKANSTLRQYGIAPLVEEGHVKRGDWEKSDGYSIMQRAARDLFLGNPYNGEAASDFSCRPKK
jgi:serine/threonine-protein kinase